MARQFVYFMAKVWRKESIEEMEHADKLTARILFFDGFPNMNSGHQYTSRPTPASIIGSGSRTNDPQAVNPRWSGLVNERLIAGDRTN